MSQETFMRTEQIMRLNRGRSKGEDCGHVKSIYTPPPPHPHPELNTFHWPLQGGSSVMVYFCYGSSLNACVAYIFLFWIAIWPLCGKVTVRLAFC